MFWKMLRITLRSILMIATGLSFSFPSVGREVGSLEGTWEGKLEVIDGSSNRNKQSDSFERTKAAYAKSPFRIRFRDQSASVYFGETEVKPGSFHTQIYMTNAVVFATDTGEDNDGQWVETWDFAVTKKNPETLIACFSRVVNNLDLPDGNNSKFFVVLVGELHRTSPL